MVKKNSIDICAASIDLTNAFGSISHSSFLSAIEKFGTGKKFSNLIRSLVLNSTTNISTSAGTAGPIPIRSGVRQGDPLSGILFNFAFDPVIRAIHKLKGVTILVFADDVLIIAHSAEALQQALDIFNVQCAQY